MTDNTTVDIYWINHQGKEILKKEKLAIGEDYTTYTYFSHPWIFRKSSGNGERLMAGGNGRQNVIFEGEEFLALPNEKMLTLISDGKPKLPSFSYKSGF